MHELARSGTEILLLGARVNHLWYALPLIVVVSLVYAATRHEDPQLIVAGATRVSVMITGFMLAVFAVLYLVSAWL